MAETTVTGPLKTTNLSLDPAADPSIGNSKSSSYKPRAKDTASTITKDAMRDRSSCANIRRYNSCPTKQMPIIDNPSPHPPSLAHAIDQDYDYLLHQEEERLRQQRLQYYLRVLELERKKMDRLSRSRKQEHMKKANKFRITTISAVSPV